MNQFKTYLYSYDGGDYSDNKWDYGLLKEIFDKNNIEQIRVTEIPSEEKAFVVIPGAYCAGKEQIVNSELKKLKKVVLFVTGDEEGLFNPDAINHLNIDIWIQTPHDKHYKYNKLPLGAPQHLKQNVPTYQNKKYDIYFGGQITHSRRQQLAKVMPELTNALYKPTDGFAKGDNPREYYLNLSLSRVCPAPSGAAVIDSFRFYEALEMMSFPVADSKNSKNIDTNFYKNIFETKIPIRSVSEWAELKELLKDILKEYPNNMHKAVAWWIKYKRDLANTFMRQINAKK